MGRSRKAVAGLLLGGSVIIGFVVPAVAYSPSGCRTGAYGQNLDIGSDWYPNCRVGSNYDRDGNYTRGIQYIVRSAGCPDNTSVPPDGRWGTNTLNAVKCLQRVQGTTADGIVGGNTWNALARYPAYTISSPGVEYFSLPCGIGFDCNRQQFAHYINNPDPASSWLVFNGAMTNYTYFDVNGPTP